jgi:DNA replication protein DnaC
VTDNRIGSEQSIADVIRGFLPKRLENIPTTDAEWEEHDRRVAAAREADRIADAAAIIAARRGKCRAAGFPALALDAAIKADETAAAIGYVSDWPGGEHDPERQRTILVLSGPPGCGKTVAAAWWALRRTDAPTFIRASAFAASSRYDRETRKALLKASALVLDDLGAEYADANGSHIVDLDELVDTFYGDRKPLLITTNCDNTRFTERYGERVIDRIRECGDFVGAGVKSMRNPVKP